MTRLLLVALVVLVLGSACSSPDDASPSSTSPSPLDEVLLGPSGDEGEALRAELHRLLQEDTARCMIELGFEYTPAPLEASLAPAAAAEMSEVEEAEEFGFYVSIEDPIPAFAPDPNQAHVDGLDPPEAEAWLLGLLGEQVVLDDGNIVNQGGSLDEAQERYFGSVADQQAVFDGRAELDERVAADPRHRALDEAWSSCMAQRATTTPPSTRSSRPSKLDSMT